MTDPPFGDASRRLTYSTLEREYRAVVKPLESQTPGGQKGLISIRLLRAERPANFGYDRQRLAAIL